MSATESFLAYKKQRDSEIEQERKFLNFWLTRVGIGMTEEQARKAFENTHNL